MPSSAITDTQDTNYTPALRYHFLTPIYDKIVATTCRENTFKQKVIDILIEDMNKKSNTDKVKLLDIGCGTGTFLYKLLQSLSTNINVELFGLDIDSQVLV